MIHTAFTEEMLKEVLRSIDEGIHVVDAEGITVFYNDVAAGLDGLTVEEVLGCHVLEAFPSLTHRTSTLLKVIEHGNPIYNQRQTYTNRHGKRIVTINTTVPLIVEGRRVGAMEVAKDITRIQELSEKLIELQTQRGESAPSRGRKEEKRESRGLYRFEQILTKNTRMLREIGRAKKAAATRSPVLVVGETGTGKELMVQSIHHDSPRKNRPFIAQNCAAIPSSLLEGILFGTVKGAFTGAEDRPGLFELAAGGSLFLDEVHAMPLDLQAKLLRVLEDGVVRRVGDVRTRPVDVRIFAATNEEPEVSLREGRLRKDLYYRIHVIRISLPPLRERREDIPLLTRHFLRQYNIQFGRQVLRVSPEVEQFFEQYDWPGNVRELQHAIEGAMNWVDGEEIRQEHLPPHLEPVADLSEIKEIRTGAAETNDLPTILSRVEEQLIREAMEACSHNIRQASIRLGIPRQTLQYKLKKLQIK
jgi:arginine utilization regulatory protein